MLTFPIEIVRAEDAALVRRDLLKLLAAIIGAGLIYGGVMGSFSGIMPDNWLQMLYSALKVPLLLTVTFGLCLPSFAVLNTLLGLRDDFARALRALVMTQAGLTVILCSLAPYTALWYLSFESYRAAILFNGVMFAIASLTAQIILVRLYRPLVRNHSRHRIMLGVWLLQYVFVGTQMAWVLRPFIGDPTLPTQFFREDSWTNAYVAIAKIIWETM